MKNLIQTGKCKIEFDSKRSDERVTLLLKALSYTITGVDSANQWSLFGELLGEMTEILDKDCDEKMKKLQELFK